MNLEIHTNFNDCQYLSEKNRQNVKYFGFVSYSYWVSMEYVLWNQKLKPHYQFRYEIP